ncbi:MAG TPA: hypothetical protein VGP82_05425 [Ktedonobacterales bacterium]|nr:hypothetical protein [Ktedonobacterales bacterium]
MSTGDEVQQEADIINLGGPLLRSLEELKAFAAEESGIRQLLDEKWRMGHGP